MGAGRCEKRIRGDEGLRKRKWKDEGELEKEEN